MGTIVNYDEFFVRSVSPIIELKMATKFPNKPWISKQALAFKRRCQSIQMFRSIFLVMEPFIQFDFDLM
jgi:hypothetical protein